MLGEASEELAKVEKQEAQTKVLRDRFEDDFDLKRMEQFEIPKAEGVWESFTSNRASTDANKVINILASSHLKLWIPIDAQDEKKRKALSKTERFPYGVIALRDSIYQTIPEALPLQAAMSWFAPMRGWLAILCYLYEEDDGKNGKVVPHMPVWDILNTYWISGSKGLLWACYKRYANKDDVKDQYGEELAPDENGRIILHDVWDKGEFGVIAEEEWLKKPEEHNCGHVPVLILPGNSTPLIQSGRHDDTISNVGESIYANNRHLYDTENRMGCYFQTFSGRVAKNSMAHEYDSSKGGLPPELTSSPFEKGAVIPVDVGKGEKIVPLVSPEMTRDVYAFWEHVKQRLDIGGVPNLGEAISPAAGLNIKRHDILEKVQPYQRLMERVYTWIAHELVSQYKSGDFGEMEIQGIDGSNRKFKMNVKPNDIDDSWNFEAKLISDIPQDTMANVGMAVQLHETGLMSDQSLRDKFLNVDDTDREQETLDREKAYTVAAIQMRRVAAALKEDGDLEGAQYILDAIEEMRTAQKPGVASQPGITSPMRPSADTTAVTPQPPQPSGLRKFLSRFGG